MKSPPKVPFEKALKDRPVVADAWSMVWKLKVPIVMTVACLYLLGQASETSKWAVYPYMLSKLTMLVILWRVIFRGMFPYVDLSVALAAMDPVYRAYVEAFLYGVTFLAVVVGGAMML